MENTVETNKLIAAFMFTNITWEYQDGKNGVLGIDRIENWEELGLKSGWCYDLKYDKSWDWLMSVVEEIETSKSMDNYADYNLLDNIENYWTIKNVYEAVVKFIKWYNKQNINETNNG